MTRRLTLIPCTLALAALAACGDQTPIGKAAEAVASQTTSYRCADGTRLSAALTGDAMVLTDGGNAVTLQHATSASGARYTNPNGAEFWEKAGQAMYTRTVGAAKTTCTAG